MTTIAPEIVEVEDALAATELFEMLTPTMVRTTAEAGRVEEFKRGQYLFRVEEPADRVHLLLDGAIEIVRLTSESSEPIPVAYITPGELIGDMALFTGTSRRSDGRVPEYARVWSLTRDDFERLSREIPNYGMELTRVFARRLQDLITHMRRQARRKELSGKLEYFDMPTVVQTLINAGQTGLLSMLHESQVVFAQVLLQNGRIERARCGDLEGAEAFSEIFLLRDNGEFHFHSLESSDPLAVSSTIIEAPTIHLMMEAMRHADELAALKDSLKSEGRIFRAQTKSLSWPDAATRPIARRIHAALSEGATLEDLRGKMGCSTYKLYRVASLLLEAGKIV